MFVQLLQPVLPAHKQVTSQTPRTAPRQWLLDTKSLPTPATFVHTTPTVEQRTLTSASPIPVELMQTHQHLDSFHTTM